MSNINGKESRKCSRLDVISKKIASSDNLSSFIFHSFQLFLGFGKTISDDSLHKDTLSLVFSVRKRFF